MNCKYCNTANDDGEAFCSNCGKSLKAAVEKTSVGGTNNIGMPMQRFVGNTYSVFMEIIMWLLPIAGFIAMGILLSGRRSDFHFGYGLLGLIIGLILDVVLFGPIMILMNIRSSLKNIEKK